MREERVRKRYGELTKFLIKNKLTITTMESATGGQIASLITDTEGASGVFRGAFVTYCNAAKVLQGVPENTIEKYGVYSRETAEAMAISCQRIYQADIGIGVTGSFGNIDPNNQDSVAGEVYFAICYGGKRECFCRHLAPQESRLNYKLEIADRMMDELERILGMKE